jgi:tellurite resistance protein TehA-like permease
MPEAEIAAQVFYSMGVMIAFTLWGFGLVWLFFALASITRNRFPFNLGWWGFTFPLGVFSTATTSFASEIPSGFFRVLGTIFSLTVVLLWIVVSIRTIQQACTGQLFFAPCVKEWEAAQKERNKEKPSPVDMA